MKSQARRPRDPSVVRLTWIFTYAVPLILVALLCLAKGADTAPAGVPAMPPSIGEDGEGGSVEEECEMDEEGFVYCEGLEDEEESEEGTAYPPQECLLRSAKARAFTFSSGDKLRLVLRYTTVEPTAVAIEYRLKGGRGALNLGRVNRHFGKKGLFQITEPLSDAGMSKAQAARDFVIKLIFPQAPGYCNRYYTQHLTVQKAAHNQVVWLQSDPVFGS